jgi:hypothetical protein
MVQLKRVIEMAAIIRHLFANEELTQRAKSVFGDIVEEAYLCFNKEDDDENEAFIKYSEGMTAFLSTPQSLQGCLDSDRPIAIKFKNGRIVEMSARDELMLERVDQEPLLVV